MSIKKNIIYLPYMETKTVLDSLVLEHAISVEDTLLADKRAAINLLRANTLNLTEETNCETPEIIDDINEIDTNPSKVSVNSEVELEVLEADAKSNHNSSLQNLSSLLGFQIYEKYSKYFEGFSFFKKYHDILVDTEVRVDLLSNEFFLKLEACKQITVPLRNSFNIKYVMYMEDYLFFWNLRSRQSNLCKQLPKIKARKWKFKKRKLKRLYTLKKIKKFMFFKRYRNTHYKIFTHSLYFGSQQISIPCNVLVKKIPLTERVISQYNLEFFYKLNKNSKDDLLHLSDDFSAQRWELNSSFTLYLRNFHQKPFWKLRKARRLHWNLFFKKTIRKQRYKVFIDRFVKHHNNLTYNYTFFVNFFTKFSLSWSRTSKLESFCKNLLISKEKEILKLPLVYSKYFNWELLKKKNYALKKKIGRWSYLNFKRSQCPWLQRKKSAPKAINHIQPNSQYLNYLSSWDPVTSSIHLKSTLPKFHIPVVDEFKVNYHVKLHMYRYKPNTKCMLL